MTTISKNCGDKIEKNIIGIYLDFEYFHSRVPAFHFERGCLLHIFTTSTLGQQHIQTNKNYEFVISTADCRALGMEDRNISDLQITASSEWSNRHSASNARLYYKVVPGAWTKANSDANPWLQVDFQGKVTLLKVATQGRFDKDQWVESYSLSSGYNGLYFELYKQFGEIKVRCFCITLFNKRAHVILLLDREILYVCCMPFGFVT